MYKFLECSSEVAHQLAFFLDKESIKYTSEDSTENGELIDLTIHDHIDMVLGVYQVIFLGKGGQFIFSTSHFYKMEVV